MAELQPTSGQTIPHYRILEKLGGGDMEGDGTQTYIGLARACAAQGEATKGRAEYNDFFALWQDAGPDDLILVAAKGEYAKLH